MSHHAYTAFLLDKTSSVTLFSTSLFNSLAIPEIKNKSTMAHTYCGNDEADTSEC